jgi:endonuclease/exonuclease/phosphatase family metal-dependent hydrolase
VVVYGSPYVVEKVLFIDELHKILASWQEPWLIGGGGDFNLCRFSSDKNTGRINQKYDDAFNDWINKWGLVEVNPNNRKYTCSNNQGNAILIKLDRVFISTEWEAAFPLVRVTTLTKGISDHNPLLIDSGDNCSVSKKKFRFEK